MDTIYLLDMEIRYREIIVKDRLIYLFYKSITLPVDRTNLSTEQIL